jgi:hypothetical protein
MNFESWGCKAVVLPEGDLVGLSRTGTSLPGSAEKAAVGPQGTTTKATVMSLRDSYRDISLTDTQMTSLSTRMLESRDK